MHKIFGPVSDERGIILVISLMVLLAMTALGMAVFYSSAVDFKIAGNERASRVAYYAAQSGIVDAKKRLQANTADTTGYADYCVPNPSTGDVPSTDCDILDKDWHLPGGSITGSLPNGSSYSVNITHVGFYNGTGWFVKRDGESDYWPYYRITSTGTYLGSTKMLEEHVYLNVVGLWTRAITSCGDLNVQNNGGTDSYDSSSGSYDPDAAGTGGDIFVNGTVDLENGSGFNGSITAVGDIVLQENTIVNGDLSGGALITLSNGAFVNGTLIQSTSTASTTISIASNADPMPDVVARSAGGAGSISDPGDKLVNTKEFTGETLAPIEPPEACSPEHKLEPPGDIETNNNNDEMTKTDAGNATCQAIWDECKAGGCCEFCPGGATITLPGGSESSPKVYYFKQLTTKPFVHVVTTGYVKIYVNGNMFLDNGIVFCGNVSIAECYVQDNPTLYRPDTDPAEILLYPYGRERDATCAQTGTQQSVRVDQNSHVYGKLYAPEANSTVISNNSHVYGAVIASGLSVTSAGGVDQNAEVHYDAALAGSLERSATTMTMNRKECYYGPLIANDTTTGDYYAAGACKLGP